MTGLSPSVLRAWERRHRLLEPQRQPGGHRLYTEADFETIEKVKQLLAQGRSIGEIGAIGRASLSSFEGPEHDPDTFDVLVQMRDEMLEAASKLNSVRFDEILDQAFSKFSTEIVIQKLVQTTAKEVGERWADGRLIIAAEHMLTASLTSRIESLRRSRTASPCNAAVVICACPSGEHHELGILSLSLFIENAGYKVAYLGRDIPMADVRNAAEELRAHAVCYSVKLVQTVDSLHDELIDLADHWRKQTSVHLGGSGTSGSWPALKEAGVYLWPPKFDLQDFFQTLAKHP